MSYNTIRYAVEDGILTLTLHRPEKLNAFTGEMLQEMLDAFDRADADDAVRAIIVTGEGRAFCAGADLSSGGNTFNADGRSDRPGGLNPDGGGILTLRIFDLKKPIIAAINGPAVGVGVTMTLPMDIRLAADVAKFGFVFSRRGIVPEACSSYFLPRVVGINQALEWCYSPGGLRAAPGPQPPRQGRTAARRPGDRAGDCRQHLGHFRYPDPPDDVAAARRGPPHGGAPGRFARRVRHRPLAGCPGGRRVVPRKASGPVPRQGLHGPAGHLPRLGAA